MAADAVDHVDVDVSPGCVPRPSFERGVMPVAAECGSQPEGVAGVRAPAFVERQLKPVDGREATRECRRGCVPRPSFERRRPLAPSTSRVPCRRGACPGLRLSDRDHARGAGDGPSVAGVRAPAFVERAACAWQLPVGTPWQVSPGCVPRPSFERTRSHGDGAGDSWQAQVSPGCVPRPSLSDDRDACECARPAPHRSVAGVRAPAFVERAWSTTRRPREQAVSPGCVPRPSLSGHGRRQDHDGAGVCRRGACPGLR